jgi:hypothetical protein
MSESLLDVYADLISPADLGEGGELGENPRGCWTDAGANDGRTGAKRPRSSPGIRPDSPGIRPAESRAVAGDSPNSPVSPTPDPKTKGNVYDLEAAAGPDWPAIRDDADAVAALRRALEVRRLREQGIPPDDYTQPAHCDGCGPVLLWRGAPARVIACPWCWNRRAGKPVPRPTKTGT